MTGIAAEEYERRLRLADLLRGPVLDAAVEGLGLGAGDRVLDAGCGAGSLLPALAGRVGPSGRLTGLDLSSELLAAAGREMGRLGLGDLVSLVRGDVNAMPFDKGAFDCAVSVDCVGYPFSPAPLEALREMGRVVRPGGTVAVMGWVWQQLLPGYPALEARLNTASSLVVHPHAEAGPEAHFLRAPGWLHQAGLAGILCRSYAGDVAAPLSEACKEAVTAFFEMLWSGALPALSEEDRRLFQRVTSRGSAEFILDDPFYYGFFVYACFSGTVPQR